MLFPGNLHPKPATIRNFGERHDRTAIESNGPYLDPAPKLRRFRQVSVGALALASILRVAADLAVAGLRSCPAALLSCEGHESGPAVVPAAGSGVLGSRRRGLSLFRLAMVQRGAG